MPALDLPLTISAVKSKTPRTRYVALLMGPHNPHLNERGRSGSSTHINARVVL
ncbi:hypothetical protein Pla163_11410 [Planctomycetes bacterium Pla163]|uniref:Uncharacterized protein n=1 Tax=Rohdeia mirabilis TaxID=2528008 RepID=A0A518CXV1_9BACT|nr:hypothetical protein Pla163_11410 [Planctomycetes bacterium Pla163]